MEQYSGEFKPWTPGTDNDEVKIKNHGGFLSVIPRGSDITLSVTVDDGVSWDVVGVVANGSPKTYDRLSIGRYRFTGGAFLYAHGG